MLITQISVYLENNKGTLRELTKLLGENAVDMLALSIADTLHFGITRIVVRKNDVDKTISILRENGFVARTDEVICIAVPNHPAGLDTVLGIIEENNISIEYMYSLNYNSGDKALLVMRLKADGTTSEQIEALLGEKGVETVSQSRIDLL